MNRIIKLNNLLRDTISKILLEELDVPGSPLVTVLGADMSPTSEHAVIKISVLPSEKVDLVMFELRRKIYDIQHILNKKMKMRVVPKIRFEIDKTEERAARIEKLLEKVDK